MQRKHCIANHNAAAINYVCAIYDADNESRNIILSCRIETGHLSRFTAQKHATILTTTARHTCNYTNDCFRREYAGSDIIKKKKWSCSLDEDVVNAVINEIAPDGVMNICLECDFKFRTDTVGRSDKHGGLQGWERAIKHAAETTNLRECARIEGGARQLFDLCDGTIRSVNRNAGVAESDRFVHKRQAAL